MTVEVLLGPAETMECSWFYDLADWDIVTSSKSLN